MNLQTYRDGSMAGALQKVKKELGRDAVILHTRTFKRGGFLGFGGRNVVEITATRQTKTKNLPPTWTRSKISQRSSEDVATSKICDNRPAPSDSTGTQVNESLLSEMGHIRSLVEQMIDETRRSSGGAVPAELLDTYTSLLQQHVADELAHDLLGKVRHDLSGEQLREGTLVQQRLTDYVASMIPEAGPIRLDGPLGRAKVVALVGPTGVGKTTTVAKLAAHFKLHERKNVGLITIDTYRIAAVDQLKAYARIIDVPLKVVLSPEELRDAVDEMRWMDLILIDTAGRSHNDTIRLNELKTFLSSIEPDEIHLVLSSTATAGHLRVAVERFGRLGASRLILTKLDEAVGFGVILEAVRKVNQRLSYVTMGQDVPDDIGVGSATELARLILGHRDLSACTWSPMQQA
ncbi:MAG: flagellar biosynthesis protein FlhF [Phycisphaerae bacterium]|nr:flagellar biosynthesis protein FlhF [Phycisphaerae bacterium]